MKNIKNIPIKIRETFYNSIVQSVLISFFTVIVFLLVVFLVLWSHREPIIDYLVKEYKNEHTSVAKIKIPAIEEKNEQLPKNENTKSEKTKTTPTVVEAVKKAKPAVVSIIVSKEVPKYDITYKKQNAVDANGNVIPNVYITKPVYTKNGTEKKELGAGSGFLISSNGLIITNRHVVSEDGIILTVKLNDGREYKATLVDRDPVLDVALLRIPATNLPYLQLADSDKIEVGETVIAIGNALGEFNNTVSTGVISGLSRSVFAGTNTGQREYLDKVIQTDAAINKGNSGGPLLDIEGKVVGINVAIVQGSSNIGFSIPINTVKEVINSVKKTGKIIRPYVGIRYIMVDSNVQTKLKLPYDYGILVAKGSGANQPAIIPDSPAQAAGLKEGDLILRIDGQKVSADSDFSHFIRGKKVGDIISMKVYSDGHTKMVYVALGQAPSEYN